MYKHRQIGWVIIVVFALALTMIFSFEPPIWKSTAGLIVTFIVIFAGFLFSSLKVQEFEDYLKISFGPGLIWKKFPFRDIDSCYNVRRQWIYGFGIRMIKGGWLFNVSGTQAVEVMMKNYRIYRIGTNEPEKLLAVIQKKIDENLYPKLT